MAWSRFGSAPCPWPEWPGFGGGERIAEIRGDCQCRGSGCWGGSRYASVFSRFARFGSGFYWVTFPGLLIASAWLHDSVKVWAVGPPRCFGRVGELVAPSRKSGFLSHGNRQTFQ